MGYKNQVIELGKGTREAGQLFITFKWAFVFFKDSFGVLDRFGSLIISCLRFIWSLGHRLC